LQCTFRCDRTGHLAAPRRVPARVVPRTGRGRASPGPHTAAAVPGHARPDHSATL